MKIEIRWLGCVAIMALGGLLAGCSSTGSAISNETNSQPKALQVSSEGYFLPKDFFKMAVAAKSSPANPVTSASEQSATKVSGQAVLLTPMVWLYASPTSKTYYEAGNMDLKINVRLWEIFLKKYRIPFKIVTAVDRLEGSAPGVLVLPSLVALSEREKQAIVKFRAQGGSVLASWLTGVRDDRGGWQGFAFMNDALDVEVVGDTEHEADENFLMSYGNGAITHSLPAGQRIWLERAKDHYPLRLKGQQVAGQIMDWGRVAPHGKHRDAIVFSEKRQLSGVLSRSVVLGYGERLWRSADPMAMEAIAHNALTWLLRQPDVHLAAWPFPYTSAVSLAVDSPEVVDGLDIKFAEWIEKSGGRATFYVLSGNVPKSLSFLEQLKTNGHEIGYMADIFDGFKDQTADVQSKRLTAMQQELERSGLSTGVDRGFHAPMESQDKTTFELINQLGFTHAIAFSDATDGRLPITLARLSGTGTSSQSPLVILPRTQRGPEDLVNEGNPEEGLKQYLSEFESSVAMGSLALIRFPNQSLLTDEQLKAVFGQIKQSTERSWFAANGAVARWWLDRARVSSEVDAVDDKPRLSVVIAAGEPLPQAAAVIVNLPFAHDSLKLISTGSESSVPKISVLDPWRVMVSLQGLGPGTYRWLMQFDRTTVAIQK